MVRIFVYEHITALGLGREAGSPGHSLFVEGRAMLDAIRGDFAAIPGVEVLSGPPEDFGKLAAEADWSFVIAPETDGVLLKLAEEVVRVGGRLLGPSPAAIALTSDKYALFQLVDKSLRGSRRPAGSLGCSCRQVGNLSPRRIGTLPPSAPAASLPSRHRRGV